MFNLKLLIRCARARARASGNLYLFSHTELRCITTAIQITQLVEVDT